MSESRLLTAREFAKIEEEARFLIGSGSKQGNQRRLKSFESRVVIAASKLPLYEGGVLKELYGYVEAAIGFPRNKDSAHSTAVQSIAYARMTCVEDE